MRIPRLFRISVLGVVLLFTIQCVDNGNSKASGNLTWTYTYLKAKTAHKDDLKAAILKNWFAMDSVAKKQGLINNYELIENISAAEATEWDFIVAVEYFTRENYADIADEFEIIRNAHKPVKINGLSFNQLGSIVKSEVVQKTR